MKSKLKHICLLGLLLLITGCAASGRLEQNPNAAKYPANISSAKINWHKAQALETTAELYKREPRESFFDKSVSAFKYTNPFGAQAAVASKWYE